MRLGQKFGVKLPIEARQALNAWQHCLTSFGEDEFASFHVGAVEGVGRKTAQFRLTGFATGFALFSSVG